MSGGIPGGLETAEMPPLQHLFISFQATQPSAMTCPPTQEMT